MVLRDAEKGRETVITKRGKSIAVIKPIQTEASRPFVVAGFGMWKDREDLVDPAAWVSNLRRERFLE